MDQSRLNPVVFLIDITVLGPTIQCKFKHGSVVAVSVDCKSDYDCALLRAETALAKRRCLRNLCMVSLFHCFIYRPNCEIRCQDWKTNFHLDCTCANIRWLSVVFWFLRKPSVNTLLPYRAYSVSLAGNNTYALQAEISSLFVDEGPN